MSGAGPILMGSGSCSRLRKLKIQIFQYENLVNKNIVGFKKQKTILIFFAYFLSIPELSRKIICHLGATFKSGSCSKF